MRDLVIALAITLSLAAGVVGCVESKPEGIRCASAQDVSTTRTASARVPKMCANDTSGLPCARPDVGR